MKHFIAKLTIITLGISLLGWIIFSLFLPEYYLPIMPYLLVFFYVTTILIHRYQLKLSKKAIGKFTRSNMLITFLKLILYSVVAVLYIALDSENAIPFVMCLMILYLIFSFVEVAEISKMSKSDSKKQAS